MSVFEVGVGFSVFLSVFFQEGSVYRKLSVFPHIVILVQVIGIFTARRLYTQSHQQSALEAKSNKKADAARYLPHP